jgi:hypothetical protein
MRFFYIFFIGLCCCLFSCKEAAIDFQTNQCKRMPVFVQALGFDGKKSFFSTTEIRKMGLVLVESSQPGNSNVPGARFYQHPSWKMGGWLAPILVDEHGNIYTAPVPFINMLDNPAANQNTIYKVDAGSGVMEPYMKLPLADSINANNGYGIIGIQYLCETKTLYVSSLSGSNRHAERGCIYAIDIVNKKIMDRIIQTDAMGMGISYITGQRKLYFGTGRSSVVYSVTINAKGGFSGKPVQEFSIEGLGPRGDDKVRRISTDAAGNLLVSGIEFNYNLVAAREKQETIYRFIYKEEENKWVFIQ